MVSNFFIYLNGINCITQSQHYAGVAFDAGQALSNSERNRLRNTAVNSRSLELCRTSISYTYMGSF